MDRDRGDWEIDRAIKILTEISQEPYNFEQLSMVLNLLIEVCAADKCHIDKSEIVTLEQVLFASQDLHLMANFFSQFFASPPLDNLRALDFVLPLLNHFCNYYSLALIIENGEFRMLGRVQFRISLPKVELIQEYIRESLRAIRDDIKDSQLIGRLRGQLQVCEMYLRFLNDRNSLDYKLLEEKNLRILSQLAVFLPRPTQIKEGLINDFQQYRNQRPNKQTFYAQVAVLRALGESLVFVNDYLSNIAQSDLTSDPNFWNCNAGIPTVALLGNSFGQGAFNYLNYHYTSWHYYQGYIHNTLEELTAVELTDATAIRYVLKTMLVINITKNGELNPLGEKLVENLELVDRTILAAVFIKLFQSKELTDPQRDNLKLLSANWQADIRKLREKQIEQLRVTDKRAGMFYRPETYCSDINTGVCTRRERSNSF